jgi:hypothetical protein
MYPLIGLRLPHPEEEALRHLYRVHPKVEQDEYQLILDARQRPFPSRPAPALPGNRSPLVALLQVALVRSLEPSQQLAECRQV